MPRLLEARGGDGGEGGFDGGVELDRNPTNRTRRRLERRAQQARGELRVGKALKRLILYSVKGAPRVGVVLLDLRPAVGAHGPALLAHRTGVRLRPHERPLAGGAAAHGKERGVRTVERGCELQLERVRDHRLCREAHGDVFEGALHSAVVADAHVQLAQRGICGVASLGGVSRDNVRDALVAVQPERRRGGQQEQAEAEPHPQS